VHVDAAATARRWQTVDALSESVRLTQLTRIFLLCSYKRSARSRDMLVLQNKAPSWNEHLAAYCLNFSGRVTMASVKNFQLVEPRDEDTVLLQFGKARLCESRSRACFLCILADSVARSCGAIRLHNSMVS